MELDRGRRVEDHLDVGRQAPPVLRREAQPWLGHVAGDGDHLLKRKWNGAGAEGEGPRGEEGLEAVRRRLAVLLADAHQQVDGADRRTGAEQLLQEDLAHEAGRPGDQHRLAGEEVHH